MRSLLFQGLGNWLADCGMTPDGDGQGPGGH